MKSHGIKSISIPTPCTQNWADMAVADKGRYCQSCQKTVTDFTVLSNEEILKIISHPGRSCGRFSEVQLSSLNNAIAIQQPNFSWKKFSVAAAFVGLVPFIKAEAQVKPLVEQGPITAKHDDEISVDTAVKYREITGTVVDSNKIGIPGAVIKIRAFTTKENKDDPIGLATSTNINGEFKVRVPICDNVTAYVQSIGYDATVFKINPAVDSYAITMHTLTGPMMGEVQIAKAPFFREMWWKVERLFNAIF